MIIGGELDKTFLDLYFVQENLDIQKRRYVKAVEKFEQLYGE